MSPSIILMFGTALGALAGCADSINPHAAQPDAAAPAPDADRDAPPTGKVTTARRADATYTTRVDSTSITAWTYADFETGAEVPTTGAWDLRFQRFHISTNGGVSGTGGVAIAAVTGMSFEAVTTAPATGYISDSADGNGDGMPDFALDQGDGWYDYDSSSHVLSPKPIVWIVKTDHGTTLKLEILTYYDDAGTAGWFTLHWAPL
jgi:hypothetical protein